MMNRPRHCDIAGRGVRDRGTALPLVLVLSVILAVLVTSISTYAATNLRYGGITADRSDRLSAADAGMRYAIDQLKLRNAGCIIDSTTSELPRADVDFNGATATITCQRISGGEEAIQAWAAVLTGEGLGNGQFMISTQGGNSEPKILGGPVWMSRVNAAAFDLGPELRIENGPLIYYDGGSCTSNVKKAQLPAALRFIPDLIFGPICTFEPWTTRHRSPVVPDHLSDPAFPERHGNLAVVDPLDVDTTFGAYQDIGGCRVFRPGRYTIAPDVRDRDAYFRTGDYVFDLPDSAAEITIRQGLATAGTINPFTTDPALNEIAPSAGCAQAQANDPANADPDQYGATFYMAGRSHINITTQGSLEIHARRQGNSFVSVQALCDTSRPWCDSGANRHLPSPGAMISTLTAPSGTNNPNIIYTASGNNRELIAHGLVYAPLAQMEFGNVTSTAVQKLLGGLVLSRLLLQSSASATNFEIAVPTSPIDAEILLTSTSVKNGETSIRALVEYRPYEKEIDDRIRVNSWRVCETSACP
jgi:hypothetical protein